MPLSVDPHRAVPCREATQGIPNLPSLQPLFPLVLNLLRQTCLLNTHGGPEPADQGYKLLSGLDELPPTYNAVPDGMDSRSGSGDDSNSLMDADVADGPLHSQVVFLIYVLF